MANRIIKRIDVDVFGLIKQWLDLNENSVILDCFCEWSQEYELMESSVDFKVNNIARSHLIMEIIDEKRKKPNEE